MEGNKITLVTGFFNCKRDINVNQKRSDDEYLKFFEFWARIQNDLIIFGNKDITEKALKIREKFGRKKNTWIVVIDDPIKCDPDVFEAMSRVEKKGKYSQWRIRDYDISNEALYDYVMFLKLWTMNYVSENFPDSGMLAWLDFGFNHGGVCYTDCSQFDYLWEYEFNVSKVHLFTLRNPDEELGYLKLMCMTDGIMGAPFLCHAKKMPLLYNRIKECILGLASLDMIDDDQMWFTMAYKHWPDMFELHKSDWFLPLKDFGAPHLVTKNSAPKKNVLEFIKRKKVIGVIRYTYIKYVHGMTEEKYYYWKRLKKLIKEYD